MRQDSRHRGMIVVMLVGAAAFGLLMSGQSSSPKPTTTTSTTVPTPLAEVLATEEPGVVMTVSGDLDRLVSLDRLVTGSLRSKPYPANEDPIEAHPLDLQLHVLGPDAAVTLRAFDLEVGIPENELFLFITVDGFTYPGIDNACSLVLVEAVVVQNPIDTDRMLDEVTDGIGHLSCTDLSEERARATASFEVAFHWAFPWTIRDPYREGP